MLINNGLKWNRALRIPSHSYSIIKNAIVSSNTVDESHEQHVSDKLDEPHEVDENELLIAPEDVGFSTRKHFPMAKIMVNHIPPLTLSENIHNALNTWTKGATCTEIILIYGRY